MWTWGRFSVTWGFGAMLLVAGLAGAGSVMPLVALSAVCHELGHLAGLHLAGAAVESFRLTAFGAEIRADTRYLPYGREILKKWNVRPDYYAVTQLLLGYPREGDPHPAPKPRREGRVLRV